MLTNRMESPDTDLEAEETLVSEPSEADQEPSKDSTEPDKEKGEEGEKSETEDESPEGKKEEEPFKDKVNRIAQSIAQKSIKTYLQKDQEQTRRIQELETQLNEGAFNRDIEAYFAQDTESKSEAEAEKNRKARESVKNQVLDYQKNAGKVNRAVELLGDADVETFLKGSPLYEKQPDLTVNQVITYLDTVQRTQLAWEAVWGIVIPEDAKKLSQVQKYIKEFDNAHDKEDFDVILETIKARLSSGQKRYTPDQSRNESSGKDLKGMSPQEKITYGLEREKKKTGG